MKRKNSYKILTLLLVMQWAFIQLIADYPSVVEKYYSNGLYVYISKFLRVIFGRIPISMGDVLYTIVGVIIVICLFVLVIALLVVIMLFHLNSSKL